MKKIISKIIILVTTFTKRVIAVLDMPKDIDDFITFANSIHDSMAASAYFTTLAAKITTLDTNTGLLTAANNGTKTVPPTVTIAARDIELNKVQNNLRGLRDDVQGLADAQPTDIAEDIILTAGMKVKKQGAINKQDLAIKDGPVSGSVTAVAKGSDISRSAHDWWYSIDGGETWIPATPTIQATTVIEGLTRGTEVIVRHREILPEGPRDFTVAEPFLVR
jgi:hypothetical protein